MEGTIALALIIVAAAVVIPVMILVRGIQDRNDEFPKLDHYDGPNDKSCT